MDRRVTHVLLVAGDPGEAETLQRLLAEPPEASQEAYRVVHATGTAEGLGHLDTGTIDAVLLDLDGMEDTSAAFVETAARDGVPVLLLADADDAARAEGAVARGAEDFLVKPALSAAWLRSAVRHAVARRRFPMPEELRTTTTWPAEAEPSFRTVLEQHADGVLIVDTEGVIRYANAAAEAILGRASTELEGALWGFPVLTSRSAELDITHRDGAHRVVEMYMVEMRWRRRPASLALLRDITGRKRIERALQESEARFRTIINSSSEYIVAFDVGLAMIAFNDAYRLLATELFGTAPKLGQHLEDLTADRFAEQALWMAHLQRALGGETFTEEYDLDVLPAQARSFEATYNPLIDEADAIIGVAVIAREITERKHFREALERTNEELKLFADVAGHDLREPLRSTRLYLELLVQRHGDGLARPAMHLIQAALDGTQRMRELIDDLLAYTRLDHRGLRIRPVATQPLVEQTLAAMEAAIREAGAEVTYDDLPTIRADASQLKQVFQNLLSNAIKFRGEAEPRIHISAQQHEGYWKFAVTDNGIGIDEAYAGRIFTMFERLNDRQTYAGTGIGLAICEKAIAHHGGRIWVESAPRSGATFYFTIPLEPTPRAKLI